MKCPKCKSDNLEFTIQPQEKVVEAEVYCLDCEEIVAFYWIKEEDWITTIEQAANKPINLTGKDPGRLSERYTTIRRLL